MKHIQTLQGLRTEMERWRGALQAMRRLHEGFLRNLVLPELRRLGGCYDCRIGKNQGKGL